MSFLSSYLDEAILRLPIRMLTERQKMRRTQLKSNKRQASLRDKQRSENAQEFAEKNKAACKKYRDKKRK